jgi:mono/diheme cytochrome c family protein
MARILVLALTVLTLVVAAGCGGGETTSPEPEDVEGTVPAETGGGGDTGSGDTGAGGEGDAAAGKDVYASAGCGSCHTFEDAGSTGTIGPNLDDSSTDFQGAVEQIRAGGGGMPAFEGQLSDQEIADVAAYVTQSR